MEASHCSLCSNIMNREDNVGRAARLHHHHQCVSRFQKRLFYQFFGEHSHLILLHNFSSNPKNLKMTCPMTLNTPYVQFYAEQRPKLVSLVKNLDRDTKINHPASSRIGEYRIHHTPVELIFKLLLVKVSTLLQRDNLKGIGETTRNNL